MNQPTPAEVSALRERYQAKHNLGITEAQQQLAGLIFKKQRAWQFWEYGDRSMDPALWELLNAKLKHPNLFQ